MTNGAVDTPAQFDAHASNYDDALAHGLSISGEDKYYFARGRIACLTRCLRQLGEAPVSVLDFGCGTGSAVPYMLDLLGATSVVGVDTSTKLLHMARQASESGRTRFVLLNQFQPVADIDLAFSNGFFHHIQPSERRAAFDCVRRSLRPRGGCSPSGRTTPGTRGHGS